VYLSVPVVDVQPDGFDWWNAVVGTAGIVIAIVAIVIAIRTDRRADKVLTEERRRVFELEILRELARDLDGGLAEKVFENPRTLETYELRLALLSSRLRYWDQVTGLANFGEVAAGVGAPELAELRGRIFRTDSGAFALTQLREAVDHSAFDQSATAFDYSLDQARAWLPEGPFLEPGVTAADLRDLLNKGRLGDTVAVRQAISEALQARRDELYAELAKLREEETAMTAAAKAEFRLRMMAAVAQEIVARMQPSRVEHCWWWYLWPPRWFRV
jgi:hypothetical protein